MISIIIPHYNHAKELKKCLDSILNQTYKNFEIIIIDDGSTEKEKQSLQSLARSHSLDCGTGRMRVILEKHKGANAARNKGATEAKGEFLLFCDADVVMRKDMLEKMFCALKNAPEAAYAYATFKFGWKLFKLHHFNDDKLRQNNFIHTTSLLRKNWFLGFDETISRLQDWDLWLTILERGGRGTWIPETLFKVTPRHDGMSEWIPSFLYNSPLRKFGLKIKAVERYNKAKKTILIKHKLYE